MTTKKQFIATIYDKVNELLGGSDDQLFSMLFPAQPLNYRMYQYDTSANTSALTKPFTVAENEFRLSDQLFSVNRVNTGPNGEKLSVVYNTAINNFIPKLDYLIPFIRDRAGLGNFLEEPSGETDEKTGRSLSRIELCKQLYQTYLVAKNKWNEYKTEKFESFRDGYNEALSKIEEARHNNRSDLVKGLEREVDAKANWLDDYAKWQSSEGMVEQEKLNNLYNDVVVRGKLHEVLTILGYLNASSVAEELEITKQKMRNSARSSLDESMTIYPVQFQPNNWFKALTPNLNPADLTMAEDSIRDQLIAKRKELSRAENELAQMNLMDVTPDEIAAAQTKVDDQQQKVKAAERALTTQHGKSIGDLANALVKAFPNKAAQAADLADGADNPLATIDNAASLGYPISQEQIEALTTAVTSAVETKDLQEEAIASLSELQKLKAYRAQLDSRDWKFNKSAAQQRVRELTAEVDYYTNLLAEVMGTGQKKAAENYAKKKIFADELFNSAKRTLEHIKGIESWNPTPTNATSSSVVDPVEVPKPTSGDDDYGKLAALDKYLLENLNPKVKEIQTSLTTVIEALKKDIKDVPKEDQKKATKIELWTGKLDLCMADVSDLEVDVANLENLKAAPLLSAPKTEADPEVDGMFQDIVIKSSTATDYSEEASKAASSSHKWAASGWFASAGGQSSSSSSSSQQEKEFYNQDIEIGFRVAKVSFDRGGWFNPNIFKMSNAFYHLAPLKVAGGLTMSDVDSTGKRTWTEGIDGTQHPYTLPAFPVAMIIAKDVTIRIKTTTGSSKSIKSVVESSSSSGGGLFCFSASSSSASRNSSESTMHGSTSDGYYIRIPGPQVLGYYLQFVSADNSLTFSPETTAVKSDGESEIIKAFDMYRDEPNGHEPKLKEAEEQPQIASAPSEPVPVPATVV
ncbi:MAG: hypothetical protein AAGA75_17585 [Cyanobacteria bacterium P01_E01_bin.6]